MFRGLLESPIVQPRPSQIPQTDFAAQQRALSRFNRRRLSPGLGDGSFVDDEVMLELERAFLVHARAEIAPWLASVPDQPAAFVKWFENLKEIGPGQGDPLFPWLAERASYSQTRWFLQQEVAGGAGVFDLGGRRPGEKTGRAQNEKGRRH